MAAMSMRELASETAGGERERRLYNRDFWAWTQEQAGALRRRDFGVIDWDNLIEEVETLGRSEKSAWTTHCKTEPEPDAWPAAVARVMNEELGTDYPVRH